MEAQFSTNKWVTDPRTKLRQFKIGKEPFLAHADILDAAGRVVLKVGQLLHSGTVYEAKAGKREQLFLSEEDALASKQPQTGKKRQRRAVAQVDGPLAEAGQARSMLNRAYKRMRAAYAKSEAELQSSNMQSEHERPLASSEGAAGGHASQGLPPALLFPSPMSPAVQHSTGIEEPIEGQQQHEGDINMALPDLMPAGDAADQLPAAQPTYSSSKPGRVCAGSPSMGMGFGSAKLDQAEQPDLFGQTPPWAAAAANNMSGPAESSSSGQRTAPRQRKRWAKLDRDGNALALSGCPEDEAPADQLPAAQPTNSSSKPGSLLCAGSPSKGLDLEPAKLNQAIGPLFTALTMHEASNTPVEPGHNCGSHNSSSSMSVLHGGLVSQQLQVVQEHSRQWHEQLDLTAQLPADSSMGSEAAGQAAGNSSGSQRQRARWGPPIDLAATLQAQPAARSTSNQAPAAGRFSRWPPAGDGSTKPPASSSLQQRGEAAAIKHYQRIKQKYQPQAVRPGLSGSLGGGSSSSSRTSRAMGAVSTFDNSSQLTRSVPIAFKPKVTQSVSPSSTSGAVSAGIPWPLHMSYGPSAANHPWLGGNPEQSAAAHAAAEAGCSHGCRQREVGGDPGADAAAVPDGMESNVVQDRVLGPLQGTVPVRGPRRRWKISKTPQAASEAAAEENQGKENSPHGI